jgi:hypothetical protein
MLGCDGCTMCCKVLAVQADDGTEFKGYNEWCVHCDKPTGCTIYSTKPKACGEFECVWLQSQRSANPMPPELRPDRTHVVLTGGKESLIAHVDRHRPEAYRRGPMGALLARLGTMMVVAARIGDRRVAIGPKAVEFVEKTGRDL